jgi:subtilisin family serine protease
MGNDYEFGNRVEYPAAINGVIAVGACNQVGNRADFSSTGPHIHLLAPGEDVCSTVPTYKSKIANHTNYDTLQGTSMAAPFVTGTVALMLSQDLNQSPKNIKVKLKTHFCVGQFGYTEANGHGILDVKQTLEQYI